MYIETRKFKEIFKLIHLNDNVSIIDKKDILNSWSGDSGLIITI